MGYRLDSRCLTFGNVKGFCFVLHNIQTVSGSHRTFTKSKNGGAIPPHNPEVFVTWFVFNSAPLLVVRYIVAICAWLHTLYLHCGYQLALLPFMYELQLHHAQNISLRQCLSKLVMRQLLFFFHIHILLGILYSYFESYDIKWLWLLLIFHCRLLLYPYLSMHNT
jgi:hypothetical protein